MDYLHTPASISWLFIENLANSAAEMCVIFAINNGLRMNPFYNALIIGLSKDLPKTYIYMIPSSISTPWFK